ncbi:hypothetical protein IC229_16900 [Spirosoma sp. BT702]|uniref:Organic solvent tolerance-like N-terminal domain-containing protein n=1 Tax=Spirosoma profusum TaxID=2771354 RepID=A0A927AT15_9BACT|nr:OstA-like protein [Spirosoma profusum]MBD2702330.1 hypothetical protein [Spirosoma profusum]
MKVSYTKICLLLLLLSTNYAKAQRSEKRIPIQIVAPRTGTLVRANGQTHRQYAPNVTIQHIGLGGSCDQVLYNDSTNQLVGSGHVFFRLDDATVIRADTIKYQGDEQQVFFRGQVTLQNYGLVLNTSQLDYSRQTGVIHYADKPRIVEGQHLLTMREGHYDRENRQFATRSDRPPIIVNLSLVPEPVKKPVIIETYVTPDVEAKPAKKPTETGKKFVNAPIPNSVTSQDTRKIILPNGKVLPAKTASIRPASRVFRPRALSRRRRLPNR